MGEKVIRSRFAYDDLERILRNAELELCVETARYYEQIAHERLKQINDPAIVAAIPQMGATNVHRLAVVVVALYPSQITLRREYEWAATGYLQRIGIGYEHHITFLRAYWHTARRILPLSQSAIDALDMIDQFMVTVATDVFHQHRKTQ